MGREDQPAPSPRASARSRRRYETTKSLHHPRPDYQRPLLSLSPKVREGLLRRLCTLYGEAAAQAWMPELERICRVYYAHKPRDMIERERDFSPLERFTEEDAILITYGDLIRGDDPSPLTTLSKFCGLQLGQAFNTLHILPFFPYSSDRGFAVVDFETVDPRLGTWQDLEAIETRYQLMFDGVINHVSSQSRWFQEFLDGNPRYREFFTAFSSPDELAAEQRSLIFRPRTSDVLTAYPTLDGPRHVWTTFSPDQIDLNYQNPEVLMRVLEILLLYVRRGADLIRLDAVTFLWARPGTPCVHLAETHEVVKLFRDVLRAVAPHVALVTETNVPHADNIAYFGDGDDEAHLVYNFALPPLVLHTFYTGDATALSAWAADLAPPSETTAFLNFLDSHDGIGLLAVRDLLPAAAVEHLVRKAREHGGLVSYRSEPDGSQTPYEINITWFSALNREDADEPIDLQVARFLASRAVALVLRGVPGLYLHSLFGTRNDRTSVLRTDVQRDINRSVVDYGAVVEALADPGTLISRTIRGITHLLRVRAAGRAFHPRGAQRVVPAGPGIFALQRTSPEGDRTVLCLTNVTAQPAGSEFALARLGNEATAWRDLLTEREFRAEGGILRTELPPYGLLWLRPAREEQGPEAG